MFLFLPFASELDSDWNVEPRRLIYFPFDHTGTNFPQRNRAAINLSRRVPRIHRVPRFSLPPHCHEMEWLQRSTSHSSLHTAAYDSSRMAEHGYYVRFPVMARIGTVHLERCRLPRSLRVKRFFRGDTTLISLLCLPFRDPPRRPQPPIYFLSLRSFH